MSGERDDSRVVADGHAAAAAWPAGFSSLVQEARSGRMVAGRRVKSLQVNALGRRGAGRRWLQRRRAAV
ncbi:hypothetical protein [Nannocystis punicea]|uniref:Uncharacterized protein n=1 Tax=Nannocystis punicea TaxID=2995304 RepID=A0ABY7GWT9_9BACT|nr:hypothetical protein [Nannocystis poenicansa]WAS91453.1 hypothetical protein O0S08_35165 [Nannocystis poenicansa]